MRLDRLMDATLYLASSEKPFSKQRQHCPDHAADLSSIYPTNAVINLQSLIAHA
jgi:hypothetical protein